MIDNSGGVPIVFLHSLAGKSTQWASQVEYLKGKRQTVVLDWPVSACKASSKEDDCAIPSLAEDIGREIDRRKLDRFILVGHSAGASVAIAFAAAHPERVAGLLLVDPSGDMRQLPAEIINPFFDGLASAHYPEVIEGYWKSLMPGSEAAVQARILADLRATPKQTVIGVFHALRRFDPVAALKLSPHPFLAVVAPANDTPISLHQLYPALPHKLVPGAGHWLHMDKPKLFNRILDDFIALANDNAGVSPEAKAIP